MKHKKVIIVDDESAARLILKQYLQDYQELIIVDECKDGLDAVAAINRHEPDIVFLDIQMPGLSGFQVLANIIHVPQIIFTTAYDQYALKAFDANAIDYLLKPYTKERFQQALSKLLVKGSNMQGLETLVEHSTRTGEKYFRKILLQSGSKMVSIDVSDIFYLEADKDYTRIYTANRTFLSSQGISTLEQKLDNTIFMRIHRSYIININMIKEFYRNGSDNYVVLKNETPLRVSRGYVDNIRKMIY